MNADIVVAITALLLLSFLGRGACYIIAFHIIQKKGPLFAGMITYVITPGTLVWSWLDNEKVTFWQVAAIAFILLMVWLVQSDATRAGNGQGEQ